MIQQKCIESLLSCRKVDLDYGHISQPLRGKTLHKPCSQQRYCWQLTIAVVVGISGVVSSLGNRALAQSNIEPDKTLEVGENSLPGKVELNADGNNLSLSFPNDIARADVLLNRWIDSQAGDIDINAIGEVNFSESSLIERVFCLGDGDDSDDIEIKTDSLKVPNDASLNTSTRIEITSGSLEVTNDASLNSSTSGEENAGGVRITATDRVRFDSPSSAICSPHWMSHCPRLWMYPNHYPNYWRTLSVPKSTKVVKWEEVNRLVALSTPDGAAYQQTRQNPLVAGPLGICTIAQESFN
ncbi:MAG: hypothetical protein F6J92_14590 [Symploca sp. SIO1A3]|nr:hypothetical protein [Symploca sp. SIO1A3]